MRGSSALRTSVAPGGALAGPWARNPLWTRARAVPSLDLCFADTKSLVCATTGQNLVSHTRASSGTFVGSDGVIRTAVTNLLLRSEEFNDASWNLKSNVAIITNDTTSPVGTNTADKLNETAILSTHYVGINSITIPANTTVSLSVYAKAAERGFVGLQVTPDGTNYIYCTFNLSTGVASTPVTVGNATGVSAAITNVGNGWYRCSISGVPSTTAANAIPAVYVGTTNTNLAASAYTGVAGNGIYLWGAQLEQSSTVGEYIPTTSTINSAPRFDHNPQTGESLGLLVEESRTNSIRNSTCVGAVAGTPGTLPTNWNGTTALTGLTQQIVGTGVESGITYVDIKLSGTPSGAGVYRYYFEGATAASALTGQSWTNSYYIKLAAGSLTGVSAFTDIYQEFTSAGVYVTEGGVAAATPTSSNLIAQRSFTTRTLTGGATVAFVRSGIQLSLSGATIDITLRIGLPQLEQGAFATSAIPTTSATVTRAADVAQITGSNFGVTRTNLLVRSEEFDNASWSANGLLAFGSGSIANTITAPTGVLTADLITENTSNSQHNVNQTSTTTGAKRFSVFAKQGPGTRLLRLIDFNATDGAQGETYFNLSTGAVVSGPGTIQAFPNGWYRCSIQSTTTVTSTYFISIATSASAFIYTGDGTSGIYLWGAQLEVGSAVTPYIQSPSVFTSRASSGTYVGGNGLIQTATTNLLLRSEEFDSGWTGSESNTTVTANTSTAPNGTITADTINFTNASSFRYQSVSNTPAGTTYTFSVWLASGTKTQTVIRIAGSSTGTGSQFVVNLTPTLTRYSVTVTIPSGNTGAFVGFENRVAVGGGDGSTGTIIVWGAQLEQSATVGEYIPTTSTINSAARYDHDPVSLISKGLLLEEARTNLALDSEDFSAATWTRLGTTFTVNTVASPTGATTADTLLETATTTQHILYSTAPHTFTTATHSIYVKPNGRTNVALRFFYANDDWVVTVFSLTGNGSVTQSSAGSLSGFSAVSRSIANAGNGWYRISMTATQTSRATFAAVLDLCTSSTPTLAAASGSEVYLGDVTRGVYAWGSQLEAASTASSYIATTGSTVTRAADISTSVATSVFESSWYRQAEGTFFCSTFAPKGIVVYGTGDTFNDTQYVAVGSSSNVSIRSGGAQSATLTAPVSTTALTNIAHGYAENNFAAVSNGGTVSTDTSGAVPLAQVRLKLGSSAWDSSGGNNLSGHLRRLTYWPTRLSNEVLQRITQ